MKKRNLIISVLLGLCMILSAFGLFACDKKEEVQPVVIRVEEPVAEGTTLLDIMQEMKTAGKLKFTVADGMVTEINGVKNALNYNPFWALYTSDKENSNTEWGSYNFDGQTLGSAMYGAGDLVVKEGEVYVWVYRSM